MVDKTKSKFFVILLFLFPFLSLLLLFAFIQSTTKGYQKLTPVYMWYYHYYFSFRIFRPSSNFELIFGMPML